MLYQLALLTFDEKGLISDVDSMLMEDIIRKYIDFESPVIKSDEFIFIINFRNVQELYFKALLQIHEGKFPNMIF